MSGLSRSLPLFALRPLPRLSVKSKPKSWVHPNSNSALSAACKRVVSVFSANTPKTEPSAEAIVHPRYLDEYVPGELDNIDTFIFDCDGVLWKGGHAINGSIEALAALRKAGKQLFFVTNNSAHSRTEMVQKFSRLGLDVLKTEIIGAAYAAAAWLKARNFCGKAYVIGERGIYDELEELGIEVAIRIGDADCSEMSDAEFIELEVEEGVGAIVVGGDSAFNYRKLAYASLCLQQGCWFVATNPDAADRIGSRLKPGAGAMVAAVKEAAQREPNVIAGKPSSWLLELLENEYGIKMSRTAVVGDRLDTDIRMGRLSGAAMTVLTLSGVSSKDDVQRTWDAEEYINMPHIVVPRLATLVGV